MRAHIDVTELTRLHEHHVAHASIGKLHHSDLCTSIGSTV